MHCDDSGMRIILWIFICVTRSCKMVSDHSYRNWFFTTNSLFISRIYPDSYGNGRLLKNYYISGPKPVDYQKLITFPFSSRWSHVGHKWLKLVGGGSSLVRQTMLYAFRRYGQRYPPRWITLTFSTFSFSTFQLFRITRDLRCLWIYGF